LRFLKLRILYFAPKVPQQISPGQRPHRYTQLDWRIDQLGLVGKSRSVNLARFARQWKPAQFSPASKD
jgi:hypothetical protein